MSTLLFVALVSRTSELGYDATFPDLPGVICQGADLAEVMAQGRAVVLFRLQSLLDAGEAWPEPTLIEHVSPKAGEFAILIDVSVDDPPVRVNISLGEQLLQRLDAAAEMRSMTRSGFIAHAVRVSLGERPGAGVEFDALGRRLQDELSALGRRINDSIGPESDFTRHMNALDGYVFDGVRKAADSVSAAMTRRMDGSSGSAAQAEASSTSTSTGANDAAH